LRTKCEGRVRRGRRLFRQTGALVVALPQGVLQRHHRAASSVRSWPMR